MNIFYISNNVTECAQYHVNRHVTKMIVEYAQLLSTAHRVLDGEQYIDSSSGRKIKRWKLGSSYESILYKATHVNHPSAIWVRQSYDNYIWLHSLLEALCKEYTFRYGKIHKCESIGLVNTLSYAPFNIRPGVFTEPTPAMPVEYIIKGDSIQSYKNYYNGSKQHLHNWKNRPIPDFIINQIEEQIMEKVLVSGMITPDGTTIYSRYRHDYKTHDDANGEWYMIDGGTAYVKSSVNNVRAQYISLTTESPHIEIREHFGWGTYGKDGTEPLHEVILKNMDTSHIEAILQTQTAMPEVVKVFEDELRFRQVLVEVL